MTYFIYARDGTSQIVLKRDSDEAAQKKAHDGLVRRRDPPARTARREARRRLMNLCGTGLT